MPRPVLSWEFPLPLLRFRSTTLDGCWPSLKELDVTSVLPNGGREDAKVAQDHECDCHARNSAGYWLRGGACADRPADRRTDGSGKGNHHLSFTIRAPPSAG